jgi:hypothetical protein
LAGPEPVLDSLGRYPHRVALFNDRLLSLEDGRVRVRWKDDADHNRPKGMTLAVDELLRRPVQIAASDATPSPYNNPHSR